MDFFFWEKYNTYAQTLIFFFLLLHLLEQAWMILFWEELYMGACCGFSTAKMKENWVIPEANS